MAKKLLLKEGSRVVIIGGGPAGSFFADAALHRAKEMGINIHVTIFDRRCFSMSGQSGCNMCAGVISESLYNKLSRAQIILPDAKVRQGIEGYYFQTLDFGLQLHHPEQHHVSDIITVFRGGGPRNMVGHENMSFDDCLLKHAEKHGAEVICGTVEEVDLPHRFGDQVNMVYTKDRERLNISADLVVGAFGLNTTIVKRIVGRGVDYSPPHCVRACNAELYFGDEYVKEHFGKNIYCFSLGINPIKFAAFTPKGDYVTVSLIGKTDVTKAHLVKFLKHPVVQKYLPDNWEIPRNLCICFPKIPVTHSKKPYADRLVIIGDAAISRFYKSGIESALTTAQLAVDSAFEYGVAGSAFRKGFYREARRVLARDNFYGHFIYSLNNFVSSKRHLMTPHLQYAAKRPDEWAARRINETLWGMVTGNLPYRDIFIRYASIRFQISLLPETIKAICMSLAASIKVRRDRMSRLSAKDGLGPLGNGDTVAIIGGGPAGTSCAISLLSQAKKRGINLRVVLYEWKCFDNNTHNECAGVLSPPIKEIMENQLGIPFPDHLVESHIKGYYLHSKDDVIKLEGADDEISYGVLRQEFDKYMLDQAREAGAEIINSRVTDIELGINKVTVYSKTKHTRAEVVVGAFGLEEGSGQIFERECEYVTPRHLLTLLTKYHPDDEEGSGFLKERSDYIHAFLPANRDIEFGAVTPKADHYTINIAGEKIHSHSIERFLELDNVLAELPAGFAKSRGDLDFHRGCFPVSPAKELYGDRYVAIGDAAGLIRPFKGKGVNSACLMGMKAAEVMMNAGVSKVALKEYFNHFSEIVKDIPYARAIRRMVISAANRGYLSVIIKVAREDKAMEKALFYSVAGTKSYKKIVMESVSVSLTIKMAKEIFKWMCKKY